MGMVEMGMASMRARLLLARNIHAVLRARGEDQTSLAAWCHKKPSWINKILAGKRPMHIDDFDRVADFLGLSVYQLFQPGISQLTERRKIHDRRIRRERRIGHAERLITLRASPATGERHEPTPRTPAAPTLSEPVRQLIADATHQLNLLLKEADPGRQAPPPSPALTKTRARRRAHGRSDAPPDPEVK